MSYETNSTPEQNLRRVKKERRDREAKVELPDGWERISDFIYTNKTFWGTTWRICKVDGQWEMWYTYKTPTCESVLMRPCSPFEGLQEAFDGWKKIVTQEALSALKAQGVTVIMPKFKVDQDVWPIMKSSGKWTPLKRAIYKAENAQGGTILYQPVTGAVSNLGHWPVIDLYSSHEAAIAECAERNAKS